MMDVKNRGYRLGAVKKIVRDAVEGMDQEQRRLVLIWAKKAQEITDSKTTSTRDKLSQLGAIGTASALWQVAKLLKIMVVEQAWKKRSWPARGGVLGFVVGIGIFGGNGAGIAAFGGAIGINLFLLTTAGGTLLATIISEIGHTIEKRDPPNPSDDQ